MPSPSPSSAPKPKGENAFQGYWRVFGGIWQVLRSTYFWVAVVLTVALPKMTLAVTADSEPKWIEMTLGVVPSILGFALGGMAIMLAFSSGKFLEAIRQGGKDKSYLRKMMASFFHFTLVLTFSLIVAYVSKFYPSPYLSFVGVFSSIYGILLVLATASRIWHTARIFNAVSENDHAA